MSEILQHKGVKRLTTNSDADNDPDWIALDLLSQAEHDESAQSILVTDDAAFGQAVAAAVAKRLETLERRWAGDAGRDEDRRLVAVALRNTANAAGMTRMASITNT